MMKTVTRQSLPQSGMLVRKFSMQVMEMDREKTMGSKKDDIASSDKEGTHTNTADEVLRYNFDKLNIILLNIFTWLPPKSLFKFKCLSKEIKHLTEQPWFVYEYSRNLQANNPFTGFFYQNGSHDTWVWCSGDVRHFVPTCPDARPLPDSDLNFLKDNRDGYCGIVLIDSCRGLLLCERVTCGGDISTYCVCNPLTMETAVLPDPPKRQKFVEYALFVQVTLEGFLRYRVIGIRKTEHVNPWSELLIYSSETGKWREVSHKFPSLSYLSFACAYDIGSKVVVNDYLFWDCLDGKILVCNFKNSDPRFETIEFPKSPLGRCLWVENGKVFCYCYVYEHEDSPLWSLCFGDDDKFEWKNEDSDQFRDFIDDVSIGRHNYCGIRAPNQVVPRVHIKRLTYNPNTKTMYLWISNSIYTFEFTDKRNFEVFLSLPGWVNLQTQNPALPYVHSLMPMEKVKKSFCY